MTVISPNRSLGIAFVVVLLTLAVALTTALVLAAERNLENPRQHTFHFVSCKTLSAQLQIGPHVCCGV